jgi:dipeptidyl-peptidase-4
LTGVVTLALAAGSLSAPSQEKRLTVEGIFGQGPPIGTPPDQISWSPDGRHLTYLEGGELMEVDSATGRAHVLVSAAKMSPLDENDVSEQDRDHRVRYHMSGYFWAPDSVHLLFDSDGRLWLYDLHNGTGVQIGFTGLSSGDDPKFSPDGSYVSFIRDNGLAVIRLRDPGTPMSFLVSPPNPGSPNGEPFLNGGVDWVYEEELDVRSNYFWSPDSKNVAYLQMNETQVPRYPITDLIPNHATVEWQRYPQPGDLNPEVHVGVVSVKGGKTTWVKLPIHENDDYVPRLGWVDAKTLWIEVVSRDHKHRVVYFADSEYGDPREMLEIDDEKFVDENYDVSVGDGAIVLTSWSDGHNHLYLYSYDKQKPLAANAKLAKQLTQGDFEAGDVYHVDASHKWVGYASNEGNPLEQQIWRVNFDGDRKQLSQDAGFHQANFSPDGSTFTDEFSTRMQAPVMRLCHVPAGSEASASCRVFWETHALDSYHLRAPESLEVKAQDGTTLFATLLLPADKTAPASVPMIVNPYGGPGVQIVQNKWDDHFLFDELLAQQGYAVLHADNRGTGSRGRAFAQAAYHDFGTVQLEDQLAVIDLALAKYPQLDAKRMGWWGWSWGGTFTLYAMTHSDRFKAGVAVAPVTDWRNYDSIYTERYLGLPAQDPDGYRTFSAVNFAANLKGRLMLAHGTGDDNVHLENTVQFVQKLIEAGIPYDLQIFPRKTHSIAGEDVRTELYNRILAEFDQYLRAGTSAEAGK